jgi:ubiquinone/menaquinone biosynthesis C-methylase UbiE
VTRLPFADQQFDKLISIHTLYFWPHPDRAIAEIFRVLKPGGTLALTFSPGKIGENANENIQSLVEQHILPAMQHLGFAHIDTNEGPASRQFRSIAIIGVK